jgi:hypothetical protein
VLAPRRPRRRSPASVRFARETLQPPIWKLKRLITRWTRTQRIRTAARIPIEAVIVDHADVPVYLKIADQPKHPRDLGISDRAIGRALRVSDKTVAKAPGAVDVHVPAS